MMAFSLVVQFRLWDDLNDVERDRADHPDRVLCRAARLSHFYISLVVLFAANLLIVSFAESIESLWVLVALNVAFLVWYRWLRRLFDNAILDYHVVLLKYPIFIVSINAATTTEELIPIGLPSAIVYLCMCVFEVLDDRRLDIVTGTRTILAIEMAAMLLVSILMAGDLQERNRDAAWIHGILSALGGFAMLVTYGHYRRRLQTVGRWRYAILGIAFLWLLSYSAGNF